MAAANPQEWFIRIGRIGILAIIDKELAIPLVHSAAGLLNRLIFIEPLAVAQSPESFLPGRNVLHVLAVGINWAASFEH